MKLTEQDIKNYQAIHKEYYGVDISKEKAMEDGLSLIRLMQLIHKPIKKSTYEKIEEERRIKRLNRKLNN